MQKIENPDGAPVLQESRERTRLLRHSSRCGCQEYFDRGFGKIQNTDFEPLHRLNG